MARILIGNIKGPKGDTGARGATGPTGPVGPQGPLPPLINNALATQAGISALDAVMGKTLQDQITQQNRDLPQKSGVNAVLLANNDSERIIIRYTMDNIVYQLSAIDNGFRLQKNSNNEWETVWNCALKDDFKSYFPEYFGSQITNDTMNLNNKLNGVWYGGVAGSTNNLPTGVKNALVRLLKYSSSAVFLEVIDMDSGVRHSNLWQASAGWFGWK